VRAFGIFFVAIICCAGVNAPFRYITVQGHSLRSANGVPVEVSAPPGFRVLKPTSRHATFDEHPYEVSIAALASRDAVVMLHAEKVTDQSAASNYDKLPASMLRGFRLRSQCASIETADVAGEHDLQWLAERGWSPVGNLAVEQHLKSSADHNREIVVSFITKVKSCADKHSVDYALARLRTHVRVTTKT